jgi:hypothetical protein
MLVVSVVSKLFDFIGSKGMTEEFYVLGHNAVYSLKPTDASEERVTSTWFLACLFFDPEDGGDLVL